MSTVDKTWVFASDNEGLADVGDSSLGLAHDSAGNPGGSLEFLEASPGATTHTERARRATTGETWETWGVPASSTVTDVQVISFDSRDWGGGSGTTSLTVKVRVVDSAGTTVHAAGDLQNVTINKTNTWSSNGAGTSRAVDAGKQASTTDVRIEIELTAVKTSGGTDVGIDNVLLRITYTTGGGSPQTVSVTGKGSAAAFGAVKANIRFTVNGLGSAAAFGTVTAVPGAVTKPVSGLGSAAAFGSITVLKGNTNIAVPGLGSAAAFGSVSAGGGTNVSVPGLGSSAAFGAVTPVAGPVSIAVPGLGSAAAFGAVTPLGGTGPTFIPAVHGGKYYF